MGKTFHEKVKTENEMGKTFHEKVKTENEMANRQFDSTLT